MKIPAFYALLIFTTSNIYAQARVTGIVKDADTGELLIGANVFLQENKRGSVTDLNGHFFDPDRRRYIHTDLPIHRI